MGTYINLSILPSNISNSEWEQVYEESLKLVDAFPFADVAECTFFGYKPPVYEKAEEKIVPDRHWTIRGDLKSKRFAETFTLYRNLNHYKFCTIRTQPKRNII